LRPTCPGRQRTRAQGTALLRHRPSAVNDVGEAPTRWAAMAHSFSASPRTVVRAGSSGQRSHSFLLGDTSRKATDPDRVNQPRRRHTERSGSPSAQGGGTWPRNSGHLVVDESPFHRKRQSAIYSKPLASDRCTACHRVGTRCVPRVVRPVICLALDLMHFGDSHDAHWSSSVVSSGHQRD
jgi:hypothetical protein